MSSSPEDTVAVRAVALPRLAVPAVPRPSGPSPAPEGPAFAAGFAAGYADGLRRASEEARTAANARREREDRDAAARAAATRRAAAAVEQAAARLTATADELVAGLSDTLCDAVVDLTEAVLGLELDDPGRRATAALRRVLAVAGGTGPDAGAPVRVHLHPDDAAALDPAALGTAVTVVADPAVAPGDALAGAGAARIDARVREALARARAAVTA
jgi:flagellar assembly protein FliH